MKPADFLKSLRLENFKAIQDSKVVKFTPLTVLIGNNGSGKSSLIEGLETYRTMVVDGLDASMDRFFGMEHVWNKRVSHEPTETFRKNPIRFRVGMRIKGGMHRAEITINAKPGMNGIFLQKGKSKFPKNFDFRNYAGEMALPGEKPGLFGRYISRWQFLSLLPDPMGRPAAKRLADNGTVILNRDGSNLAQYLLKIRDAEVAAFEGIVEAMKFVLDYANNLEPYETREIQPTMYLKMLEQFQNEKFEIPGWMISTGTIRILALLAVLRNPNPPPLIVVEEVENGLDPRAIHMILDEIRETVQGGRSQVILTTHSPYLLDLLPLQSIILVERKEGGNPTFWRPSDSREVKEWAKTFAPGQLYTTGRFKREARK